MGAATSRSGRLTTMTAAEQLARAHWQLVEYM